MWHSRGQQTATATRGVPPPNADPPGSKATPPQSTPRVLLESLLPQAGKGHPSAAPSGRCRVPHPKQEMGGKRGEGQLCPNFSWAAHSSC